MIQTLHKKLGYSCLLLSLTLTLTAPPIFGEDSSTTTTVSKPIITETKTATTSDPSNDLPTFGFPLQCEALHVISPYGFRSKRMHKGVDLGGFKGDAVIASADGKVIMSKFDNSGYGNVVMIDHGKGVVTLYAHCNERLAKVGDVVQTGDVIATVGRTGNASCNHVHFEIQIHKKTVDPMLYLVDNTNNNNNTTSETPSPETTDSSAKSSSQTPVPSEKESSKPSEVKADPKTKK